MTLAIEQRLRNANYTIPPIAGHALTIHALARMIERGIHADAVRSTLAQPAVSHCTKSGNVQHQTPDATVMVDAEECVIVTVSYGATRR